MVNIRAFIAAGLALVAVVLVFIGLFSNGWLTGEIEDKTFDAIMELDGGLREAEMTTTVGNQSQSEGGTYSEAAQDLTDLNASKEQVNYFEDLNTAGSIAYFILWGSVLICIAAIVFAILGAVGKMTGKNGMIIGFAAGVFITVAAILFAVMSPSAPDSMKDTIWEKASLGWTFYLVIVGGVLQCVGGGLMIGIKKKG